MASTYSNLKIQLMATGENSGTWGNVTNANLGDAIEQALVETATVTFASANVTLTLSDSNSRQDARALRLNLAGTTAGARDLIVPAIQKPYLVNNGTADTITVKVSGQTGVAVPASTSMLLYNNGTDVVVAFNRVVGTATTLQTARNIQISGNITAANVSFDGSADVNLNVTAINADGITSGTLGVARGGTGATSLNSEAVVIGNSTGAVKFVAPGTSGNVLTSNGTAWASQAIAAGGDYILRVYTSPATWTKPASVKAIKMTVVGGGGAGGTAGPGTMMVGGGGGGGGAAIRYLSAPSIPGPISVTVGSAGNTSSFGPLASATGGSAGAGAQAFANGGAGGIGSSGDLNIGGGGGGGGMIENAAARGTGGAGGNSILGGGGNGVVVEQPANANGIAGRNYGGGGGGAARSMLAPQPGTNPGGAGAAGVVIVEEFY